MESKMVGPVLAVHVNFCMKIQPLGREAAIFGYIHTSLNSKSHFNMKPFYKSGCYNQKCRGESEEKTLSGIPADAVFVTTPEPNIVNHSGSHWLLPL
jgi:hypothetical protein